MAWFKWRVTTRATAATGRNFRFIFDDALHRAVALEQNVEMVSGLIMLVAAQAAAAPPGYGPSTPAQPKPKPALASAPEPCKPTEPKDVKADTTEIVVCAQRVEGYRIDPDVLEAARAKKNHTRPRRPERLVDNSCQMVGPMGCRGGAGINLVAAAVTAVTMVERAVKGENVGEMFITDPQPDEYQLYLEAKHAREAREAEQKAALKAKTAPIQSSPPPTAETSAK